MEWLRPICCTNGYFGEAGSLLARRDEAALQAPCIEEQRRQGAIMISEIGDGLALIRYNSGGYMQGAGLCRVGTKVFNTHESSAMSVFLVMSLRS